MGGADDEEFQVLRAMAECMGPGVGRFTGSTLNVASLRAAMLTFSSATMETRSSLLDSRGGQLQLRKSSSPGKVLSRDGRTSYRGKAHFKLTGEWGVSSVRASVNGGDQLGLRALKRPASERIDSVLVGTEPFDSGAERNVFYAQLSQHRVLANKTTIIDDRVDLNDMLNMEPRDFNRTCTQVVKESKYEEESTINFHETGMQVRITRDRDGRQ